MNTFYAIDKTTVGVGNLCRTHGVNLVLISSLICRRNIHLNSKVKRISICQENGFIFINNGNIVTEDL